MNPITTLPKRFTIAASVFLSLFFTTQLFAEEDVTSIFCPDDVTVHCQEELWDLSIYGNAQYHDYDGFHDAGSPVEVHNLSSCNVGTIYRTWSIEDPNWNILSCTQHITVTASGGFTGADIHWPNPVIELTGCNPAYEPSDLPDGYGFPTYNYAECSLIGVSYKDHIFNFGPQCQKILRKYKVIDWCTYDDNGWGNVGLYEFTQTIKISMSDLPVIDYAPEIVFQSYNCDNKVIEVPPLYIAPSTCGGLFTITNNSPYATTNGADISGDYPIGTTRVKYTVSYGCTGKKYHYIDVKVQDASKPHPYCLAQITTALMPIDDNGDGIPDDGMVEIWAKDVDFGSNSPCGYGPVQFSFSPDEADMFKVFNCEHVGDNYINMYVTDTRGKQSYCQVNVRVQNNSANIPDCEANTTTPTYNVAGMIQMPNEQRVAAASISIISTTPITTAYIGYDTTFVIVEDSVLNAQGYWEVHRRYDEQVTFGNQESISYGEATVTSDEQGNYILPQSIQSEIEYMVSVSYDGSNTDINYADVKALLWHIQGKESLNTAYQYLAADVNQDGVLDYDDLSELLQYVNNKIVDFSASISWVTVDASHTFVNASDIINGNCPEAISVTTTNYDMMETDFVAIQIGDITDAQLILVEEAESHTTYELSDAIANGNDQEIENITRSWFSDPAAQVSIFPNPFNDVLTILYPTISVEKVSIEITDVTGRILIENNYSAIKGDNQFLVTLPRELSGLLICNIRGESMTKSIKVIKE